MSLDSDQNLSGIRLSGRALEALPDDPEVSAASASAARATTGTRLDLVAFYVDGLPLTRLPPKDVIQSVRINANPFSAEFAEPGASRVEILTKPASEHYHGNGRIDFNDSRLNGRDLFEPNRPATRPARMRATSADRLCATAGASSPMAAAGNRTTTWW